MKLKLFPLFLMLVGGLTASVVMFAMHYELWETLLVLLIVLVVFYIAGIAIAAMFRKFDLEAKKAVSDEGAVIEKEAESEEDAKEGLDENAEKAET